MCGIIGAVADHNVVQTLINGLKRLEYRGYDSAGIAIIDTHHHLQRMRTLGKICELERSLENKPLSGHIGVAHTRWATHGSPSEKNAHPHLAGNQIAIVHNGIIENYQLIRKQLLARGCVLESETDSELIAHLIYLNIQSGKEILSAVRDAVNELSGAFAIGILFRQEPDHLIAVRKGSPLVIGLSEEGHYIASDALALLSTTKRFLYLEENDIADVYRNKVDIYDGQDQRVERSVHIRDQQYEIAEKGDFEHYMLKEIFEQPEAISAVLQGRVSQQQVMPEAFGYNASKILSQIRRVQIVACGTSFHAGLVGRHWLEEIANIPCQVEIASEYRYRNKVIEPDTLFVTLSQSGETADTLAALRLAKQHCAATLTICNVPDSSVVRESDLVLMTNAGPEIGVASTKAFTTQLVALLLLTLTLSQYHQANQDLTASLLKQLHTLPDIIEQTLKIDVAIKEIAHDFIDKHHALFLGRGIEFPIALEGALKLKEISYIHAEAYPAGELKHGPLALVDANMPIIALAPSDDLIEKLKSNLEEVVTRGGKVLVFSDKNANIEVKSGINVLMMPLINRFLAPIAYAIPMQLLAYHVAALKGTDVDQPRNLAKSVTVE